MGMSTHVVGIKPPNEKWRAMKMIYDACKAAGIDPPEIVTEFFNDETPDEKGVIVDIDAFINEWVDDSRHGFVVDIDSLPDDIKFIRFYNSW